MTILTIGPSPYLLTREGRINREVIRCLKDRGHHVESIVTYHDIAFFLPDEAGIHYFNHDDGSRTRLHPYLQELTSLPIFLIETMRRVQPNLIMSIGDYGECASTSFVKARYSSMFKWIILNTTGMNVINDRCREALNFAEYIIATCEPAAIALSSVSSATVEHVPYGPDTRIFKDLGNREGGLKAMMRSHNRQSSNVGTFIRAIAQSEVTSTLHTNMDDQGDYDIQQLVRRYGLDGILEVPKKFVSMREGIADENLNELYNRHHVIADCSLQSGTALSLLEGMSTGCIPVGMDFGAVGDVLAKMPQEFRCVVSHESLLGPGQEEHAIMSLKELATLFSNMKSRLLSDPEWFKAASNKAKDVSRSFSKENFAKRVIEIVENVLQSEHAIVIDTY